MDTRDPLPVRRLLACFGPELWRERRTLAISYALLAVSVGATLAAPWPVQMLIDGVLLGRALPDWLPAALRDAPAPTAVALLAVAAAAAAAAGVLAHAAERLLDARVRERIGLRLRRRVLAHALTLSPLFLAAHRSGDLVSRLVQDAQLLVRLLTRTTPLVVRHVLTVVSILGAMLLIDVRLGAVGLVLVPALALLARRYGRRLADRARAKRRREGDLAGVAQELVRALPVLQGAGLSDEAVAHLDHAGAAALRAGLAEARVGLAMERALQLGQALAIAAVAGLGGMLVLRGEVSVGTLTVALSYVTLLLKPVEKVNQLASALTRGLAGGERLLAVLDRAPEVSEPPLAVALGRTSGCLELRGVHFRYPGAPAPVLRDASLRVVPGALTVLTGPSGAGKSTVVHLALRLFDPDAGELCLDGHPYPRLAIDTLRAQIAFLPQQAPLLAGTLRAAMLLGVPQASEADCWRALSEVALDELVRALPGRLDSPLGEDGANLSGGQRRRLALARVLLLDRPLLLLDEPTAGIDPQSEAVIVAALARASRERACLVVSHRAALRAAADSAWRLENGVLEPVSAAPAPSPRSVAS